GGPADYFGISYARLNATDGVFWPCPSLDHDGTPRLFGDSFPTPNGRAHFHAISHRSIAEEPNEEYPLLLTTGRLLAQYQSGTQTRRTRALREIAGEPCVEIHPVTASALGISPGDRVTLKTRRGTAIFTTKTTTALREDTESVLLLSGQHMSLPLPLFTRASEDGVTFMLTPRTNVTTTGDAAPASRMPLRAPGPGEQYRFHVDMGKCIGCKCCVVACNEQNGNPAAINWRRVSEIEGGWYPRAERSYMSIGCHQCLEPTCLQGCPVDAYKKDGATGIVLHSA